MKYKRQKPIMLSDSGSQMSILPVQEPNPSPQLGEGLLLPGQRGAITTIGNGLLLPGQRGGGAKESQEGEGLLLPGQKASTLVNPYKQRPVDSYLTNSEKLKLNLIQEKVLKPGRTEGKPRQAPKQEGKGKAQRGGAMRMITDEYYPSLVKDLGLGDIKLGSGVPLSSLTKDKDASKHLVNHLIKSYHIANGRTLKDTPKKVLDQVRQQLHKAMTGDIDHIVTAYGSGQLGGAFFKSLWKGVKKVSKGAFKLLKKNWKPILKEGLKLGLKYAPAAIATATGNPELAPGLLTAGNVASSVLDKAWKT